MALKKFTKQAVSALVSLAMVIPGVSMVTYADENTGSSNVELAFSEDFNSYETGVTPNGWTKSIEDSRWEIVTDNRFGDNSMRVTLSGAQNAIGSPNAKYILDKPVTGKSTVMFDLSANAANNRTRFSILDSKGTEILPIFFDYEQYITINFQGPDAQRLVKYETGGVWYTLKMVLDPEATASDGTTGAMDIYVNDVCYVKARPLPSGSTKDIGGFLTCANAWNPSTNYYDNIKVYAGVIPVESISLDQSDMTLLLKDPDPTITATVMPKDAANKTVIWESSNESVATIDEYGKITKLAGGTTTITGTTQDGNKTASLTLTVQDPKVESIKIKQTSMNMLVNETLTLNTEFTPSNATNQNVTWTTDNQSVATVDDAGIVTALSQGDAKITVTTEDGGKIATADIHVIAQRQEQQSFYVDSTNGDDTNDGSESKPFKTLPKAVEAVKAVNDNMTGDIYVYIKGTYNLEAPITLDETVSGTNGFNVVFKGIDTDNEKATITGNEQIKGWTLYDQEKNIYRAIVDDSLDTRQLFVNGVRAYRSTTAPDPSNRYSNKGLSDVTTDGVGHTTTDTFYKDFKNIQDMECTYAAIWTYPRCPVASIETIDDTHVKFIMKQPAFGNCRNKGITSVGNPYLIENAYELIDVEGEWYLDKRGTIDADGKHAIYYKPKAGEDMTTALVVAPTLENLVFVQGTSKDNVSNHIQLDNIKFQYTTWLRPNEHGQSDAQGNVIRENYSQPGIDYKAPGEQVPAGAALTLHYADNIVVRGCEFVDLGCNGINVYAGSQNNLFIGNKFKDLSAGGMQIGDVKDDLKGENSPQQTDERLIIKNNDVLNNYITNYGMEYRSSIGIAYMYNLQDSLIAHNEVCIGNYTGISGGWGWAVYDYTVAENNVIEYNYVHDTMRFLNDGGDIYLLGRQGNAKKPSYIRYNYLTNVSNQGLYLDDGSTWWVAHDNVFDGIGDNVVQCSSSNRQNIHVSNLYATKTKLNVPDPATSTFQVHTPIMAKQEGEWIEPAQKIIDEAGLQAGYQYLKD